MNKQEIQHKLDKMTEHRMDINDSILWLKEHLAEAEKPKRQHGNFGFDQGLPRLDLKALNDSMFTAGKNCCGSVGSDVDNPPDLLLGNVFDLMKDWDKPFEDYKKNIDCDNRTFIIEKSNWTQRDLWIGVKDNDVPTSRKGVQIKISEAEEIWHALGHAIAELKRKKEISGKK